MTVFPWNSGFRRVPNSLASYCWLQPLCGMQRSEINLNFQAVFSFWLFSLHIFWKSFELIFYSIFFHLRSINILRLSFQSYFFFPTLGYFFVLSTLFLFPQPSRIVSYNLYYHFYFTVSTYFHLHLFSLIFYFCNYFFVAYFYYIWSFLSLNFILSTILILEFWCSPVDLILGSLYFTIFSVNIILRYGILQSTIALYSIRRFSPIFPINLWFIRVFSGFDSHITITCILSLFLGYFLGTFRLRQCSLCSIFSTGGSVVCGHYKPYFINHLIVYCLLDIFLVLYFPYHKSGQPLCASSIYLFVPLKWLLRYN